MRPLLLLLLAALACLATAQPVGGDERFHTWSARLEGDDLRAGESAEIVLTAKIQKDWYIYKVGQQGGPQGIEIDLSEAKTIVANGAPKSPEPKIKFDKNFNVDVGYYEDTVEIRVPVKTAADAKPGPTSAKFMVISQVCTYSLCDRPREDVLEVSFEVAPGETRPERVLAATDPDPPNNGAINRFDDNFDKAKDEGLWAFLLFSFLGGLAALLTPCVFPMIPVTVSFFSKQADDEQARPVRTALLYCIGIITTFAIIGVAVTVFFGASGVQQLSTNPYVNGALFLVFVLMALSLFGVLQFQISPKIATALSSKSKTAGVAAPILLGLTFSITSFTCTVPLVGAILAAAATGGSLLFPVLGMAAFGTALALPFFFLALFPRLLKKLPRSGQWMVTVKAFMGFLELVAAVKFLSNIDLVYQWGAITTPVFLAIWAIILATCGLYMMGWMRLPTDSSTQVGMIRSVFGLGTIAASVYCLAGIQGQSMGNLAAFLPPSDYGMAKTAAKTEGVWEEDFELAKIRARREGKPIFIDFTGVTCTNCRWMESNMFPKKQVQKLFQSMVLVKLYTDRLRPKELRDRDEQNRLLQQKLTRSTTLPVYVVASPEGEPLAIQAYTTDEEEFVRFLTEASARQSTVAKN